MAFCKYRTPPWISFVDRDDVPAAKSSNSTKAVLSPRVVESNAHPAPVAPPPIINTSNSSSPWRRASCSLLGGNCRRARFGLAAANWTWNTHPHMVEVHPALHSSTHHILDTESPPSCWDSMQSDLYPHRHQLQWWQFSWTWTPSFRMHL